MALSADIGTGEPLAGGGLVDNTSRAKLPRISRLPVKLAWLLLAATGLLSLGGYATLLKVSDVTGSPGAYAAYVALFAALFALYLLACYLLLSVGNSLGSRPVYALVGVIAVASRAILLPAPPTLSNDIYRYVWDGRVIVSGVSPYRYAPDAPQLEALRSPVYDRSIWQYINRKSAITIYPPGAEIFYALMHRIAPDSVLAMKSALVAIDLASCAMLALLLGLVGMLPTRAIVYAWSPLPIIEFGGSGHVEALSVFWTLAALLLGVLAVKHYGLRHTWFVRGRGLTGATSASVVAALCLGAAILVKLIPVLLLAGWLRRFGWKVALLPVSLFGLVSAIFVQAYGGYISPFLVTYLGSEESNAPLYYTLRYGVAVPLGIPDGVVRLLLGGSLAIFALYLVVHRECRPYDFVGKCFLLVMAYLVLATSAHAWYSTWLLLFVPLFLPPDGLPLLGKGGEWDLSGRDRRRGHGVALAALAYTGVAFLGYLGFAWSTPASAWPVTTLEFSLLLAPAILLPAWGRLFEERRDQARDST